jgi:hypothetical protein
VGKKLIFRISYFLVVLKMSNFFGGIFVSIDECVQLDSPWCEFREERAGLINTV